MKKKLTLFLMAVYFVSSLLYASSSQKIYTVRDDVYRRVDELCRRAGVLGPSSFSPMSSNVLLIALDRIDEDSLSISDQREYSELYSKLTEDESLFERKIKYLSGGEREKVYLMSALMVEPRLLLLDEALASLDEESSENLINELFAKSEEYNFALVFVSHNYKLVERIADKIYILEDGKLTRVAPS